MSESNFDVITSKQKIEEKIEQLEIARNQIIANAKDKAKAISEYDRALTLTIIKLKNGNIKEFEGIEIKSLPATLIYPVAKGIVFKESLKKEEGEALYKACITIIEAIKAELNGLQSINKYHD